MLVEEIDRVDDRFLLNWRTRRIQICGVEERFYFCKC